MSPQFLFLGITVNVILHKQPFSSFAHYLICGKFQMQEFHLSDIYRVPGRIQSNGQYADTDTGFKKILCKVSKLIHSVWSYKCK